jgi:hypothetical protein
MKTAVEFFADGLEELLELYPSEWVRYKELFSQAKEMEKQQIIKAHVMGIGTEPQISPVQKAEQYYNETFKKDGI